jgi:dihydrofolate reductase
VTKLTISINVTVDGCCDHTQVVADDEHMRYATDLLRSASAILLGRVTYEMFRDYWPKVAAGASGGSAEDVAWARELDGKRKFVLTRGSNVSGWNTSVVSAPDASELKRSANGDLVVFGSPSVVRALVESKQADEVHLLIQPIAAGRGPRLFDGAQPLRLRHVDCRRFRSGVLLSWYAPILDSL